VGKSKLEAIDCRGCNEEAVATLRGASCATVNPDIPPALCLALKAFSVSDDDIKKISQRPHWAHGAEYFYEEKATCVAAGDPANGCSRGCGGQCDSMDAKIKSAKTCTFVSELCPMALWCSGSTMYPALGLTVEQSSAWRQGTLGYGSWAAQAQEIARAVKNGGEHPSCPAATVRAEGPEPCIDIIVGKAGEHKSKRVCDGDCKSLPYRYKAPPSGVPCGLRFRYPALFPGPDAVPGGAQYGQYWGSAPYWFTLKEGSTANYFYRCKFAGYKSLGKPRWGPDEEDGGYFARDQSLFHTKVFGKDICTEFRSDFCGGRWAGYEIFKELNTRSGGSGGNILKLPGCRSDMAKGTSLSTILGLFRGSDAICAKKQDPAEPNSMRLNMAYAPSFGVDTCGPKTEREQPAFECFGPARLLKPGESMRYGFRCKKDEEGMPPFGNNNKLPSQKMWCPKGGMDIPDMCRSSTWLYKMPLPFTGRFSPGKGPVAACVRLGLVCNGHCNCKDCSDEADCTNRPLVVGAPYDRIGWSTPESKLRCRRAGDPSPKDLPENILRCEKEGIVI